MSSFKKFAAGLIVGVGTIAGVSSAQATVTEYEWTGTIVNPGTLGSSHGVLVGDTIVGSFFYDNEAAAFSLDAVSNHSFSVGGFSGTYSEQAARLFNGGVDGIGDQFDFSAPVTGYSGDDSAGVSPSQIFWRLNEASGTAISDNTTLPEFIDLADWPDTNNVCCSTSLIIFSNGHVHFDIDTVNIVDATPPIQQADLSISKTDDPDSVVAGQTLTYTVTVDNNGPDDADNVVVSDTLPASVTFVGTSGCINDANGVPDCQLGTIANEANKSYTIMVTVNADTAAGTITNSATVTSDAIDDISNNDTASEDTDVIELVDIDIKPGSFPNSINSCSKGAIPIAILGSEVLDVTDIDQDTLAFAGAGVKMVGKTDKLLCSFEDVSGDFSTGLEGAPDGELDLVCHYVTVELAEINAGDTSASVSGAFKSNGEFVGTDSINIVKDDCL